MQCLERSKDNEGKTILSTYEQPGGKTGKPEIFVFPGIDDPYPPEEENLKRLSSFMKTIETRLSESTKPLKAHIVGVNYSGAIPPNDFVAYYRNPEIFVDKDARAFVDKILVPRLFGNQEKPTVTQLQQRISNITFVTFSYGGIFAQQVCNGLRQEMDIRGYTPKEIEKVCQSGVQISAAGLNVVHTKKPYFSALNFRSIKDPVLEARFEKRRPLLESAGLNVAEVRERIHLDAPNNNKPEFSCQNVSSGVLVTSPIPKTMEFKEGEKTSRIGKYAAKSGDISHEPRPHWCLPVPNTNGEERWPGDLQEPDNSLAVKLKIQALYNAVGREPKDVDPMMLMMRGNLLSKTERFKFEKQFSPLCQV